MMTMQITITNADKNRVAVVHEQEFDVTRKLPDQPTRQESTRLGPGEARSFWIHAAKTLLVVEDPNG